MKIPLPAKLRNESEETLARTYGNTGQREKKSSTATTPSNNQLPIYIYFIDDDGEVFPVPAMPDELTSHVLHKYVRIQGTTYLLSGVMFGFKYNGKAVSVGVTLESMGIVAGDDKAVIYVRKEVPSGTEFNKGIVPSIPEFVNNHPHGFIDQLVWVKTGEESPAISSVEDYDEDTDSFLMKY